MSELINQPAVSQDRCRCLRSKGMFIDVEPDATVPSSESGMFWCIHTQNCLGPDGRVASLEECKPGRGCFEPI